MLLYLGSFEVPGAPGITVFPDHEDPLKFYCIREVPKLSIDAATKDPLLYYTSIRRDARMTQSDSVNLGYMTLTVDVGATEEEQEIIRKYIVENYIKDIPAFRLLRMLFPFLEKKIKEQPIRFGTISWKEGTAQLELMEGMDNSFKSYGTAETTPSLFGNCHASFSENFGAEGDLLMRSLLNMDGGDPSRAINMGAVVRYVLNGFGYIPALSVTVKVDTKKIYDYFKEDGNKLEIDSEEDETKTQRVGRFRILGRHFRTSVVTTTHKSSHLTMGEIESHLNNLSSSLSGAINVTIDDLSGIAGTEATEWSNQIVSAYISAITETIVPSLFTPVEVDKSTGKDEKKDADNDNKEGEKNQKYYTLKTELHGSDTQDLTLKFKKSGTVPLTLAPQGTLMINGLTDKQKASLVREVDIADDAFQGLSIPVEVNANFQEDNIYAIEVDVLYNHKNAITGKDRNVGATYKFKTGDESYLFRATMAKDAKGNYQSSYKYRSRILFKDQSEFFGGGDGWSEYQEQNEKILTISYGKIGFLRTSITPGNFDEDIIKEAIVHLNYLGADKNDTKADIRLLPSSSSQIWKCFKYRSQDDRYQYSVKYFYQDGTVYESEPVTETASSITILDPFVTPLSADFMVKMGAGVANVKLEVLFQDGKYEKKSTHSFTSEQDMESWHWAIKVRKGAKETMKYRYIAFYNESDPYTSEWTSSSAKDETIFVKVKSDPNAAPEAVKQESQLTIDSSMLSWDKWKRVYVILKDDSGKTRTLPLNADEPITTVDVIYSSNGMNACQCSCQFLPQEGAVIKTAAVECTDVFIIEEPKTEQ